MSKNSGPAQKGANQKPSFWILIIIWLVIFYFVFRTPAGKSKPVAKPTADQLYAQLVHENAILHEADANQTFKDYRSALQDELTAKKITPQQELSFEIRAAILVADAQLRGAEKTGIYDKYIQAFETLDGYNRHHLVNPAWTKNIVKISDGKGGVRTWTGIALYNKIVTELSAQNHKSLALGFIPGYAFTDILVRMTGSIPGFSYWFAMLFLAVFTRGLVWPLTRKQLLYSRQMQQLIPRTKEIKAMYPKDMQTQQAKTMELYKEYGINPLAGCWPLLIQSPFFIAIYEAILRYQFQFQKGTFLWINPHFSAMTHGLTAPNLGQQDNSLIIIYGITMLCTQWLMPIGDPSQAKQQRIMGTVVSIGITGFMFVGAFPVASAFVLYWTFTNLIATFQSLMIYRLPVPALEKVQTVHGGQIVGKNGQLTKPRKPGFMERMNEELAKKISGQDPSAARKAAADPKQSIWDKIDQAAKNQVNSQNEKETARLESGKNNGSINADKNGTSKNGTSSSGNVTNTPRKAGSKGTKPKKRSPK